MATWCKELIHLRRPWCWARLKAGGEGDDRGWDGWMASPNQWAWVWVNSGSWWWTRRPGVLQSMGLQRVRPYWMTELNWRNKGLPVGSDRIHQQCRRFKRCKLDFWCGKIPWCREWLHTAIILPREFQGQRNLVGYSLWDCRVRHDWVTKNACKKQKCYLIWWKKSQNIIKLSQRIISKIHSFLIDFRGIYFKIYREFPFDISCSVWYNLICLTSGKAAPVSLYNVTAFSSNTE